METIFKYITKVTKFMVEKNLLLISLNYIEDNSIFYVIQDGKTKNKIIIEIFLDESDEEETIVNIFNDKKLIFNHGGNIDDCLEAINNI